MSARGFLGLPAGAVAHVLSFRRFALFCYWFCFHLWPAPVHFCTFAVRFLFRFWFCFWFAFVVHVAPAGAPA